MHQQKSKKVLIYFFLFLLIGTLNNKNLNKLNLMKLDYIIVTGLNEKNNNEIMNDLDFLRVNNLFFLDKPNIIKIMNENTLIEKYSIFKKYPSSINVKIDETNFLAQIKKGNDNFLLGSNGKLTKTIEISSDLPFIFGTFENKSFLKLKKAIDETNFNFKNIKNLFFFKSGRWDIETKNGLLIKLPQSEIKKSLNLLINFLNLNSEKKIREIDLRQKNQIILNG